MVFTSLVNWMIERLAYRPLRGSFRLAPLISAIGMSIFLIELRAGRRKGRATSRSRRCVREVIVIMERDGYEVAISLQAAHHLVDHRGPAARLLVPRVEDRARPRAARLRAGPEDGGAGRRQRRPHHLDHLRDRRRARGGRRHHVPDALRRGQLLRRLRAGHQGVHRRGARRHRLAPRRGDRRAADRPDRDAVVGLFLDRLQGRRRLLDPRRSR